jgi:alpha-L-fucosidase
VTNEGDVWLAKKKDADTVYAYITKVGTWTLGEKRSVTLRSVKASDATRVRILGQTGTVLEYRPDVDPRPSWRQDERGLQITAMMAQRLYDDRRWPDPVVLEITHASPGLTPPSVETRDASRRSGAAATLTAFLKDLGQAPSVDVGFQYRRRKGTEELYEKDEPWRDTPLVKRSSPGEFSAQITELTPGQPYEFRAVVKHPLITLYGEDKLVPASEMAR